MDFSVSGHHQLIGLWEFVSFDRFDGFYLHFGVL
jgi:hypothetical protein